MAKLLFANNASTTLAGAITNVALTCAVQSGAGVEFPSPGAAQYFLATFVDAATGLLNEIVQVTTRSTDTMTIVRAQEGTTALAWNAGDLFSNLWTAGSAGVMLQTGVAALGNFAVASGTNTYSITWNLAQTVYLQGNPQGLVYFTNTNTSTTVTLNDGTGAKNIVKLNGAVPQIGDLVGYLELFDDGSNWRINGLVLSDAAAYTNGNTLLTTAGSGTFTALYTGKHRVTGTAGGAGGGYNSSTTVSAAGGGGGGGCGVQIFNLVAGNTYAYVIGSGGAGGLVSGPTAATNGGITSFNSVQLATGGAFGAGNASSGGAGVGGSPGNGTATGNGSQNFAGVNGFQGWNVTVAQGGFGGAGAHGGGAGAPYSAQTGNAGFAPGGGGGGAGQGTAAGGAGAAGQIFIEW